MNCEMCGKKTEDIYRTNIEGVEMKVCGGCSKYGKVLGSAKKESPKKQVNARVQEAIAERVEVVVPDYSEILRKTRERLGMKQEDFAKKVNEKESQIHKMETGSIMPDLKTAKKLEKMLQIRLVEEYVERQNPVVKSKESIMTLGDMIKIKKR